MVITTLAVIWLAVIPAKEQVAVFIPPGTAFENKADCEDWLKGIKDLKGQGQCVPVEVVRRGNPA